MRQTNIAAFARVLILVSTIYCCQPAISQAWTPVGAVEAQDISIGKEADVWITATDNSIYKWNGVEFEKLGTGGTRISAGPAGTAWAVTKSGQVIRYSPAQKKWSAMSAAGMATDIGVGDDGSIWIIGTKEVEGGYEIFKREGTDWEAKSGGAIRIAVDAEGNPWMVNDEHKIFNYVGDEQKDYDGEMQDVGIGADGSVWAITIDKEIVKLQNDSWVMQDGTATAVAVTADGNPWILDENGVVQMYGEGSSTAAKEVEETDEYAEKKNESGAKSTDVKTRTNESVKEKPAVDENRIMSKEKEVVEKESNENNSKEKELRSQKPGTPVEFYNSGNKPVEVYRSSSNQLGELVTEIRPNSRVKIPVNLGDEFEIGINKEIGKHPKIYISSTSDNINLFGNGPLKDVQFLAEKFSILDYQSNQAGIDLTKYNPRDLVNTINKGRIFQILDIAEGIDYRIVGDGKIMKYGFEYASANHHEGSNEVSMSYGYNSFSKNWSLNVGGSGSIPIPQSPGSSVNPALDFGYSEDELENKSYENTYAYSREQKSIFTIAVDPKKAQLDQEFKDAVLKVTDMTTAKEFVEQYGTHYPKVVYYGGDRSVYVVFNKEQYSKAKSFGIDLKAKVGVSKMQTKSKTVGGAGGDTKKKADSEMGEGHLGFEYKQGSEEESVFENTVSKYRMIGGSGGFDNWDVDEKNAAPIAAELDLIYTLIEPQIFKDGSDPAVLAKAKALIQAAIDDKLKSMPLLKAPLPPPNVYSISIEKMEVIEEIDDANKNTMGNIYAEISLEKNGTMKLNETTPDIWSNPEYTLDFKFVKGTVFYPHSKPYKFTHFPETSSGKFLSLAVNIKGSITEKDDLAGDDNDEMTGQTGNILIQDLNLAPGQSTPSRTFDVDYHVFAHENKIRITYKIRREPSEFDDKLMKW